MEASENEESSPTFFVVTIFCFVIETWFFLDELLFLEGADDDLLDVFLTFLPVLDCLDGFADSDANPNKDCNACLPASVTEFENEESSLSIFDEIFVDGFRFEFVAFCFLFCCLCCGIEGSS